MLQQTKIAGQAGVALVIVLWIVTLLSVMAASFAYTARTETRLTTYALERAQARALIEAGVAFAVNKLLLAPDPENPWPIEGSPRAWRFGTGTASLSVVDSVGKIDLNHGHRELLGGLLASQDLEEDRVDALLDAIEDWRDPDSLSRLNGAELEEYLAAGRNSGPKNAPFESVEELQQVLGMTPQLFAALVEHLTVAGHQGINPEAASPTLLRTIPGVDPELIETYIQERSEAIEQGQPLPSPPPLGNYLSNAKGLAYHMVVDVTLDSGTRISARVVVAQARRPGQVFHVISWREGR